VDSSWVEEFDGSGTEALEQFQRSVGIVRIQSGRLDDGDRLVATIW
jgi:hypothetical protein